MVDIVIVDSRVSAANLVARHWAEHEQHEIDVMIQASLLQQL
jgi:hypothetical protein